MSDQNPPTGDSNPGGQVPPNTASNQPSPLPELGSFDLAGGKLPPAEEKNLDALLAWDSLRQRMQWWAFLGLGIVCLAFLLFLMMIMYDMITDKEALAVVVHAADWHVLTFLGIALIVFASVPLSIALAILRMVSQGGPTENKESKEELALTTPQLELVKTVIVEVTKALKGS